MITQIRDDPVRAVSVRFDPPKPAGKLYRMTGAQELRLPGLTVSPGAGEFRAVLDATHEEFLIRVGAIKPVEE